MKKILFTIAIVLTMVLGASAQTDGFFRNGGNDDYGNRDLGGSTATPRLPQGTVGGSNDDQAAPLGSGLVILTALGAGYAVKRSRE